MRKSPLIIALGALALLGAFIFQEKTNDAAALQRAEDLALEAVKPAPISLNEAKTAKDKPTERSVSEKIQPQGRQLSGPARFYMMPDGTPVPPLPSSAPKKLKLSVVLFAYSGAQMTPAGFRSRADALLLAQAALASASLDMKQAIAQGDPGSASDIGWVRRNVLEKYVEYRIFSLKKGELLPQVIDTPRGFWIVKRTR